MATRHKKRRMIPPMLQKDPGPWSQLLIEWLATLGVLIVFGLVMLYSASYTTGYLRMGSSLHYIRQQLICAAAGVILMMAFSFIDHRFLRWAAKPGYWIVAVLLVITRFMPALNGCPRWIRLFGVTLQTSELAKFELILLCSGIAARAERPELKKGQRLTTKDWFRIRFRQQLLYPVLPIIPVAFLLIIEPHMSAIILTTAIIGSILLLTGCGGIFPWACIGIAVVAAKPLLYLAKAVVQTFGTEYMQGRMDSWLGHAEMKDQTLQSLYAIGSGGLTGRGLGNSVEKQLWLPESNNDFIFSVVCEELGFIGALLIIVLFVVFILQGLKIAYQAENLYCTMVGIGIMAQIAWQVFCNIAVVTNTIPNTGISLPFFSSGGTSLLLLMMEMGVMVNIGRNGERAAQQREQRRAEREAAHAAQDAERAGKTIDLDAARRARGEG